MANLLIESPLIGLYRGHHTKFLPNLYLKACSFEGRCSVSEGAIPAGTSFRRGLGDASLEHGT